MTMILRDTLAQYPTHGVCVGELSGLNEKLAALDAEKGRLQSENAHQQRIDGVDAETKQLVDLRNSVQELVSFMSDKKSLVLDVEGHFGEMARELSVLNPSAAETGKDRGDLIKRAEDLTRRLQEQLKLLQGFDTVDGQGDELGAVMGETRKTVRALLGEFFGEGAGSAGKLERQLELLPSENERRLAVFFYTQANPRAKKSEQAVDKFFASKEYKTLRAELVANLKKRSSAGPDVKAFVEMEFAKLAAMKTTEDRQSHANNINYFLSYEKYASHSTGLPYTDPLAFKGTHSNEGVNENIRSFILKSKYWLLHLDVSDIGTALPSYAVVSLFGKGELDRFGLSDKWFQDAVHLNEQGGYLNFVQWRAGENLVIKGKKVEGENAGDLQALVLKEMQEVARELAVPANALSGYKAGSKEGDQSSKLFEYDAHSGLRVNTHTGAIESQLPHSETMNQVGHVAYQTNKKDGERNYNRHLVNQRMAFGSDDPNERVEPLDLSKISGFKDVPEGYSLKKLLDQVSARGWELLRNIEGLKNYREVKSAEEIEAIRKIINEFTGKVKLLNSHIDKRDRSNSILRAKKLSVFSFITRKQYLIDGIAAFDEEIECALTGLKGSVSQLRQYGLLKEWDLCNVNSVAFRGFNQDDLHDHMLKEVDDGKFVVGLAGQVKAIREEFERLKTAFDDIYSKYSGLYDSEIEAYKLGIGKSGMYYSRIPEKVQKANLWPQF